MIRCSASHRLRLRPDELELLSEDVPTLPVEEVTISDPDSLFEESSEDASDYDPEENLENLFAGLDEQNPSETDTAAFDTEDDGSISDIDQQSASHEFSPEEKTAILEGFHELAAFIAQIDEISDVELFQPFDDLDISGGISGLNELFDTRLYISVFPFFNPGLDPPDADNLIPTDISALITALENTSGDYDGYAISLDDISGEYDAEFNELIFSLSYQAIQTGELQFQAGERLDDGIILNAPADVQYKSELNLVLRFGR